MENTFPHGFDGLHKISAFTPGCRIAASNSSASKSNAGGFNGAQVIHVIADISHFGSIEMIFFHQSS